MKNCFKYILTKQSVISSHHSYPRDIRRDTSVDVGQTLSARDGPGENSHNGRSGHQRSTVISIAVTPARSIVRAQVRVVDSGTVSEAVRQTTGSVGDGRLGHPLHDIRIVAGQLEKRMC